MDKQLMMAVAACVEASVPVMLWGPPGIGKTEVIESAFGADGWHVETVIASISDPTDFKGLPVRDGDRTLFLPPDWAVAANEADRAVVFFDEITTCEPSLQAALLRVTRERSCARYKLVPSVRLILAGNPPEEAANGFDLAPPMANRLCHLYPQPSFETWSTGMTLGFAEINKGFGSTGVLPFDHARFLRQSARIAGYCHTHRDAWRAMPKDATKQSGPWASSRSWENAARILSVLPTDATDVRQMVLAGCVSEGIALAFLAWERTSDLPDPEKVMADPTCYDWADRRIDRTFAMLGSVVGLTISEMTETRWGQVWDVLAAAARANRADVGAIYVSPLVQSSGARWGIPAAALAFKDLIGAKAAVRAA